MYACSAAFPRVRQHVFGAVVAFVVWSALPVGQVAAANDTIFYGINEPTTGTSYDPATGKLTVHVVDPPDAESILVLTDFGVPLNGSVRNLVFHLESTAEQVDEMNRVFFRGGEISLTFEYSPTLPPTWENYEVSGSISYMQTSWHWFTSGFGRLEINWALWNATTIELPGSNEWNLRTLLSAFDGVLDFDHISDWDWETESLSDLLAMQAFIYPGDNPLYCLDPIGDDPYDGDYRVDLSDYQQMMLCVDETDMSVSEIRRCLETWDADASGYIDAADVGTFAAAMYGPAVDFSCKDRATGGAPDVARKPTEVSDGDE